MRLRAGQWASRAASPRGCRPLLKGTEPSEASEATEFEYHQHGDLVWARYEGGAVRLGFLVGTRLGDRLEF